MMFRSFDLLGSLIAALYVLAGYLAATRPARDLLAKRIALDILDSRNGH
ncbi:MAG TPA: hypothetical protein VGS78_11065 [Candidatus Sulfotelmatobacter sp.]|nr:hypothetical protein [Candidatus Sulfotelmatobacter sp.]